MRCRMRATTMQRMKVVAVEDGVPDHGLDLGLPWALAPLKVGRTAGVRDPGGVKL